MKFDLEKFIYQKIIKSEWKPNNKIPSEIELIKISNLSKMSIRKVVEKFKEREILYSIQGKGVFVSSFFKESKIEKLSEKLGATKVTFLPSTLNMPKSLLKKFDKEFAINEKDYFSFVKFYFIDDEVVAYTVNWLCNKKLKLMPSEILNNKFSILGGTKFEKVINLNKFEQASQTDSNILLMEENSYIPTTYSYYVEKNRNIYMMRIVKVKPKYFNSFEIKNK